MDKRSRGMWRIAMYTLAAMVIGGVCMAGWAQEDGAPPAGDGGAPSAADAAQPGAANAPVPPAQNGRPPEKKEDRISFIELLLKGKWFMLPIALCSLLGVGIILERLFALRRGIIAPPAFMPGLAQRLGLSGENREDAIAYCHQNDSPIGRIMAVGIRKMPQGVEAVEQAIEDAGANEVSKLRRNLRMLYGVAAIAPMLGLLGTVWGMIEAFQVAAQHGLGRAELLAEGIYEALVTTFAGLCVAIPVLVFYYFFLSRIETLISHLNDLSERFMADHLTGSAMQEPGNPATSPPPIPGGQLPWTT